ncbi:ASST-domain-containing protein [Coniella lustricola]|uniref:ASST-domain-containing protein n=1 Tax=Coniella lustricola TaxID=2025994 RepID=A0A2T3A188_9PEZI|nr:ASST-domain-containing protein [Coniella lustricola]
MQINATGESRAPGLIFFRQENAASTAAVEQVSPFIMTDDNDLIWSGPTITATNFRQQLLYNQSIITYWEGTGNAADAGLVGLGYGKVLLYDNKYELIQTICLQLNLTQPDGIESDCEADVHESYITNRNSILVTAYNVTQTDATSIGGPADAWIYDPLAVEIDIKTGEILFLWSPLAHVPINATQTAIDGTGVNASQPFDWFHMNSIQWDDGNYLINARNTWASYYVNSQGDVLWEINRFNGGTFGSLPENISFSWQHDARIQPISSNQSLITWFANDNSVESTSNPSQALGLLLTLPPNTEHPPQVVIDLWDHANPVSAYSQGAVSRLDNGNYIVGYGAQPYIKEFGPKDTSDDDLLWSAQFAAPNQGQSYRAYKQEWHATPASKPNLTNTLRGYVSWNGATDVTSYMVYVWKNDSTIEELGTVARMGFETKFSLPADSKAVQIGAIEGTSSTVVRKSDVVYIA